MLLSRAGGAETRRRLRVAVVISTRNRAESLRKCLRSVRAQQPVVPDVIVVDDASTDETSQVLREECRDALVIRVEKNVGSTATRNMAARASDHDVLFFLDDDSELAPDAVAIAGSVMAGDERIGVVVATILENGRPLFPIRSTGRSFTNLCVGNGAFRRRAFAGVGMYLEGFYDAEEMDLSLRLLEYGYRIVSDPRISIIHHRDQHGRRPTELAEHHRNILRVLLMRAPASLLAPWALKTLGETIFVAGRSGVRTLIDELATLPRCVVTSLRQRDAIAWQAFAVWRYLSRYVVTSYSYPEDALRRYPTPLRLLFGYLTNR